MMVQPRDQMSAGLPYPRGPLSMISGAMYCSVPAQTDISGCDLSGQVIARKFYHFIKCLVVFFSSVFEQMVIFGVGSHQLDYVSGILQEVDK